MILDNAKAFLKLYYNPSTAMSDVIDKGSWLYGAIVVLIVASLFQFAITDRIHKTFGKVEFNEFYTQNYRIPQTELTAEEQVQVQAEYEAAYKDWQKKETERRRLPLIGDRGLWLFSFHQTGFLTELVALSVFYVPLTLFLIVLFTEIGNFGAMFRRDYATLSACAFMAWAAAHLPFALIGFALLKFNIDANVFLALWFLSSLLFGVFMVFALRTIFSADYDKAILTVVISWIGISFGSKVFAYIPPFAFMPWLLIYAFIYLRSEVGAMGQAFGQRQNFKRFLENATINPNDADAHVQLGLIHLQRRQVTEATTRFERAISIDPQEPDANFQLGRIEREKGNLQKAIDHFGIVVAQNEKHSNNEIWREIGATYLSANMLTEAHEALEKYVERRPFDPEGLYYLGQILSKMNKEEDAKEMFRRCIEAVDTMPFYRRGEVRKWRKMAKDSSISSGQ
jgi:tetratricopeptide (TPR) repeat protein